MRQPAGKAYPHHSDTKTPAAKRKPKPRRALLTDAKIKAAKRGAQPFKLYDERGLFLLVTPSGGKLWRFKYRRPSTRKENSLALGGYPDTSLADARELRDAARKLLAAGLDPGEQRQAERKAAGATFEVVAREWFAKVSDAKGWTAGYGRTVLARLEQNAFPHIGAKPIGEITTPDILRMLKRMEARGVGETRQRVHQLCSAVFCWAVANGRGAERDPTIEARGSHIPVKVKHRAAITEPAEVAGLLRVLDSYQGSIIVRCALRLAPLVFVRPGELRKAEWLEIDLDAARWLIPPWRMKMKQALIVPLSRQAVAILRELQPVTGDGRYVFPSARSAARPMSDNAILSALRRSDIAKDEMSGHGFRATARTILAEVLHVPEHLIEHQLAHAVQDALGRAYNRTSFLPERIEMMQTWSDYLDELKAGGLKAKVAR